MSTKKLSYDKTNSQLKYNYIINICDSSFSRSKSMALGGYVIFTLFLLEEISRINQLGYRINIVKLKCKLHII